MIYLTGYRDAYLDDYMSRAGTTHGVRAGIPIEEGGMPLGLMIQPKTTNYLEYARLYRNVFIDNGCFLTPQLFHMPSYLRLVRAAQAAVGEGLIAANAPDTLMDWGKTLAQAQATLPLIRREGCPASIVLQNGVTPNTIPWDAIDCIFLGGGPEPVGPCVNGCEALSKCENGQCMMEWKVGKMAEACCREAKRRGKWVHAGRVNTHDRMRRCRQMGCDSADGNYLLFEPSKVWPAGHFRAGQMIGMEEAVSRLIAILGEMV